MWDILPRGKFLGGAPFNTACHLKMLNQEVLVCSRVGDDQLGEQVINEIKQRNINPNYIQIDTSHTTGIVEVTLDTFGNASYHIKESAAWDFIEVTEYVLDELKKIDILIYGSLAQRSRISKNTIKQLLELKKVNVFDVNLRPPYINVNTVRESLMAADIVKMNYDEFLQLAKWFSINNELKLGVKEIADKFNCSTVCITKGANGAAVYHNFQFYEHPGFVVKVKDTVGSGDAFLAAFLKGIFDKKSNQKILEFANAVGAYVATQNGATPKLDLNIINEIIEGG
ncbi:MAG: carbohydrate kinase [Ignavibacteriaceae bacterium]|nr:carbohydrate kinase [Ignavibacteriaceae bacterium]